MSQRLLLETDTHAIAARELTGILEQVRGCMGFRSPPEQPIVWRYDDAGHRSIHMLGVPFALEAAFAREGRVVAIEELRPWIGLAAADADMVIEYPPGSQELAVGDSVSVSTPPRKSASEPLSV